MTKKSLLGRAPEIKQFEEALKAWEEHPQPSLITVTGPAGVGRSAFMDTVLTPWENSPRLCRVSLLRDSFFRALAKRLGRGLAEEGVVRFSEVIAAWTERYAQAKPSQGPLLVIEDLQECEGVERGALFQWLQELLQGPLSVLICLEYQKDFSPQIPLWQSDSQVSIELKPWDDKQLKELLESLYPGQPIPEASARALGEKTHGLPLKVNWWIHFLSGHSRAFYLPEVVTHWPQDETALALEILPNLSANGLKVLQAMQVHPSWINLSMIAAMAGVEPSTSQGILQQWAKKDYVVQDPEHEERFLLRFRTLGAAGLKDLSSTDQAGWHQGAFQFLKTQPDWLFRTMWLAFHGAEGGLAREAFGANLMAAGFYETQGDIATAEAYLHRAMPFAHDAFRRAYALYRLGQIQGAQGQYETCLATLRRSVDESKSIPWEETASLAHFALGEWLQYLGRYGEAQSHYAQAEAVTGSLIFVNHQVELALATVLMEQAKYSEARELFDRWDESDIQKNEASFRMTLELGRLQVEMGLGQFSQAAKRLEKLQEHQRAAPNSGMTPLLLLLQGKNLLLQLKINEALEILDQAQQSFEAQGDIYGKVEALLAMSAPLIELNLIKEAEEILQALSGWEELQEIPALHLSVRLRRLALAAFQGPYLREDLEWANQDPFQFGRVEDWLQFWFHLALAGKNRKDDAFFAHCLGKARGIAETVSGRLAQKDREIFLRRPDMARILRLSGEGVVAGAGKITGDRASEGEESVDAATLAPPVRPKDS